MASLPVEIIRVLEHFAPLFRYGIWPTVQVLVVGAILAPGKRTVTSALRVMGLSNERQFQTYHRVLNRSCWSSRAVSQQLLRLLVAAFVPAAAPIVVGLDETIERRRGAKIAAKGIYRDPVRSSHSHFVKASGLRWVCLMLLVPIPWAKRVWALPFLTALAPSRRYYEERGKSHKKITDWGRQMILQLRRWLPERPIVVVADSSYAVIDLLARCARLAHPVTMVTRLRLDAALYDPTPPRSTATRGRPRRKGARQPTLARRLLAPDTAWQQRSVPWYGGTQRTLELASGTAVWYHSGKPPVPIRWVLIRDPLGQFEAQALLCTDLTARAEQIVTWFVQRWQLEVTQQEARAHMGLESQRQWSDLAILRTTPALLGLFSLVTLFAHHLLRGADLPPRQAAWYTKEVSTFSDTLAFVRYHLWPSTLFSMSLSEPDTVKIPRAFFNHLNEMLAYAA
jgi:hypothetical protein